MRPSIPIAAKYLARLYDRLDEREQCRRQVNVMSEQA